MRVIIAMIFLSAVADTSSAANMQHLAYVGDFETGQVQDANSNHDGFFIRTLPNPQVGKEIVQSGQGGFGPTSTADTKVVRSDVIGSETVRPRKGEFFLRSILYYNKDYTDVNNGILDKPRSMITLGNDVHRFDGDVEGYAGLSIYTPLNYEPETGTPDDRGFIMLVSVNADTDRTFFTINQFVQAPSKQAHWWLNYYTSATSTQEADGKRVLFDLGPVDPDLGKWTDLVLRFRSNPFSVRTNPAAIGIAHAKNQVYEGNKGILQVWKAEGPVDASGNRNMVLKFSKVDVPVGLVPHESEKLKFTARVYKGGWKKHPTDVKGPVWFGFDELRLGLVERDGTTYSDVAPAAASTSPAVAPAPPSKLAVTSN